MTPILIHLQPFHTGTSTRLDVRIGSALEPEAYGLNQVSWKPAIIDRPQMSIEIMSTDLSGRVQVGRARFSMHLEAAGVDLTWPLKWGGAPVKVYSAAQLAWPAITEFDGEIVDHFFDTETGVLSVTCEVSTSLIEKPLLTLEFDGSTGLGGDASKRGTLKPAGFGSCENIPPVWFDLTRNIGMIDGYGNCTAITKLMEGASDMGASVGDYANYAALAAAIDAKTIAPGRWGTCIAQGLVGLGAPPVGLIGVNATFGSNRLGAMMSRILTVHASVSAGMIDAASFTALDAAVDYPAHFWTDSQVECKGLLEAMARSVNSTILISFQKKICISRAVASTAVSTLDRSGSRIPRCLDWKALAPLKPVWRVKGRAARPASVLDLDQVNYVDSIIDRGAYSAAVVYRAGNVVWLSDKSSWLYINATAGSGNAPPTYPALSNAYWQNLAPPSDAANIKYADGTAIEALKPANPGATNGATIGTNLRLTDQSIPVVAEIVTAQGTAAAIAGQAATATNSDFSAVTGATKPQNNATVGAQLGVNLKNSAATVTLGDTDVLNWKAENNTSFVGTPQGGSYSSAASTVTGALKIKLPTYNGAVWSNTMLRFAVDVFDYNVGKMQTYLIAGYTNSGSGGNWSSFSAQFLGREQDAKPVYFGSDGTSACVWIGSPTSTWSYPKAQVKDFSAGHSGYDPLIWRQGWSITLDPAAATNTAGNGTVYSITKPRASDAVIGENVFEVTSGAVATLANFKTGLGTAAAITGQGALATKSQASWLSDVAYRPAVSELHYDFNFVDIAAAQAAGHTLTGTSNVSFVVDSTSPGGRALVLGDNVTAQNNYWFAPEWVSYVAGDLYEITFDVEFLTSGPTAVSYFGVQAVDKAGNNLGYSYNYVCASGYLQNTNLGRRLFKGYLTGLTTANGSGLHNDPASPGALPDGSAFAFGQGGAIKFRPLALVNHSNQAGSVKIHAVRVVRIPGKTATQDMFKLGGSFLYQSNGITALTDASAVTSLGTAAAITGQAATATNSSFDAITGASKPADNAGTTLRLYDRHGGTYTITGNSAKKTANGAAWNYNVYSYDTFTGACAASFTLDTINAFGGLADGTEDSSYGAIDYAVQRSASGWNIVNSGTVALALGTVYNGVTFSATTAWTVTYDGLTIKYRADGVLMHSIATTADRTFRFACSMYDLNGKVSNIALMAAAEKVWANVGGTGKPADNATVGAQLGSNLKNSAATVTLGDGDVITNLGTAAAITGQGALATKNAAVWGTDVSGRPAELTDGRVAAGLDASGDLARNITVTRANSSAILRYTGGGLFVGELTADTTGSHTAAAITGQAATATSSDFAAITGATKPQNNADVTATAQVSIEAPTAKTINADYTGTIASGVLPSLMAQPKVVKGGTTITTANNVSYAIQNAAGGCAGNVTVDNTAGSATKGVVTIGTGFNASGSYELVVTVDGYAYPAIKVTVSKINGDPPSGGGGSTSGSFDPNTATVASTSYTEIGRVSNLTVATGKTVNGYMSGNYVVDATANATRSMSAKWQYSVAGANSWTDFTTPVSGSNAQLVYSTYDQTLGSITCNQSKAGLTAGNYDIRLVAAESSVTSSSVLSFDGMASASVTVT